VRTGSWRPGLPGHVMVSVPRRQVAEVERAYAVGQRVNLFADRRPDGWIRITDLRRVAERGVEVLYLLVFATCYPPAPPN
jgi:hypothetical protein